MKNKILIYSILVPLLITACSSKSKTGEKDNLVMFSNNCIYDSANNQTGYLITKKDLEYIKENTPCLELRLCLTKYYDQVSYQYLYDWKTNILLLVKKNLITNEFISFENTQISNEIEGEVLYFSPDLLITTKMIINFKNKSLITSKDLKNGSSFVFGDGDFYVLSANSQYYLLDSELELLYETYCEKINKQSLKLTKLKNAFILSDNQGNICTFGINDFLEEEKYSYYCLQDDYFLKHYNDSNQLVQISKNEITLLETIKNGKEIQFFDSFSATYPEFFLFDKESVPSNYKFPIFTHKKSNQAHYIFKDNELIETEAILANSKNLFFTSEEYSYYFKYTKRIVGPLSSTLYVDFIQKNNKTGNEGLLFYSPFNYKFSTPYKTFFKDYFFGL